MACSITVSLPADVKDALDDVAQREGVHADEVVGQAIKEHLFLRKFRLLRERMTAQAKSHGIVTDQDVFDRVS
jgi:predicted transcriptional regulator